MSKGICCIFGAGEFDDNTLEDVKSSAMYLENSFIIAADGGLDYLRKIDITPNVILGDFDSVQGDMEGFAASTIVHYSTEKDHSDMMLAVKYGLNQGYREFHIYGALGGRVSHTLANIQLLAFICENDAKGYIFSKNTVITAVKDGEIQFDASYSGYISIYSHTDISEGVYLKGVKYELENAILENNDTIGLSNEFIRKPAAISVTKGTLIIIIEGRTQSVLPRET